MTESVKMQLHKLNWWGRNAASNEIVNQLTSPVNWLILLNVLFFLVLALILPYNNGAFIILGANSLPLTINGEWGRLLTATFLHGNLLHLFLNMFFLYQVGKIVEQFYGRARFLIIYILSGLVASLASLLGQYLNIVITNTAFAAFSVGASGAIFGIFGLFLGASLFGGRYGQSLPIDRNNVIFAVGINLLFGFIIPGVDNFAHIGGLLAGVLLSLVMKPVIVSWSLSGGQKPSETTIHLAAAFSIILVIISFVSQLLIALSY